MPWHREFQPIAPSPRYRSVATKLEAHNAPTFPGHMKPQEAGILSLPRPSRIGWATRVRWRVQGGEQTDFQGGWGAAVDLRTHSPSLSQGIYRPNTFLSPSVCKPKRHRSGFRVESPLPGWPGLLSLGDVVARGCSCADESRGGCEHKGSFLWLRHPCVMLVSAAFGLHCEFCFVGGGITSGFLSTAAESG